MSGRSVAPRAVSMSRSDSSAEDSHRAPSRPSHGAVRSTSRAAIPSSSARCSTRAINWASSFTDVATSERAIAHGAERQLAPCRSITSSAPGFSRFTACIRPPGTSTSRGMRPPNRGRSEMPRTTKRPTSRRSIAPPASLPKPSGPLATTIGRSRRSGCSAPSVTARSTVSGLTRSFTVSAACAVRLVRGAAVFARFRGGTYAPPFDAEPVASTAGPSRQRRT